MKSISYTIFFSIFSFQFLMFPAFPAYADCQSSKRDAAQKVEQISTQMKGANDCKYNKLNIKALEVNIEYLEACPDIDPNGNMREEVLNSLKYAKNAQKVTCS